MMMQRLGAQLVNIFGSSPPFVMYSKLPKLGWLLMRYDRLSLRSPRALDLSPRGPLGLAASQRYCTVHSDTESGTIVPELCGKPVAQRQAPCLLSNAEDFQFLFLDDGLPGGELDLLALLRFLSVVHQVRLVSWGQSVKHGCVLLLLRKPPGGIARGAEQRVRATVRR